MFEGVELNIVDEDGMMWHGVVLFKGLVQSNVMSFIHENAITAQTNSVYNQVRPVLVVGKLVEDETPHIVDYCCCITILFRAWAKYDFAFLILHNHFFFKHIFSATLL